MVKKLNGFYAVLTAVFFASILFAACENPMMSDILGGKPPGGQSPFGTVDTSYSVLFRNAFMGGSLLYAADSPSSGHLVPGAVVAVRLGKVNYDPVAGAEGSADPGPMFSENTDSTRYGYITVETVDTNGISFKYTEYTADGKSSAVKGSYSVAAGEEKDISGDGIPGISYTSPNFSRSGFEKALTLNFLSSSELENLTTTMFAVLPEQYANKEYPSGIFGINPEGKFIALKYTSTGDRALVRGIETGDLIVDSANYTYRQAKISENTYRSARSIDDSDTEMEDVESPDLYFPIMSVNSSYEIEIENVDPAALQSRAVAPTQAAYQKDQTRILKAFSRYTQVGNDIPYSKGNVAGNLKLGVSVTKTNSWADTHGLFGKWNGGHGTIEVTTSAVVLIDAALTEKPVSVSGKISLLGGGIDLLKNVTPPKITVSPVFWIEIKPSIILDYLLEVTAECSIPLRGGFTGMYGATMTAGANYGVTAYVFPYFSTYSKAGSPIKNTASYFGLDSNPTGGSLTVSVGPSLTAALKVSPTLGLNLGVVKGDASVYGTISFTAKAPTILTFTGTSVTLSKELNFDVSVEAGVRLKGKIIGTIPIDESKKIAEATIWNKTEQISPPVTIPISSPVTTPTASPASGAVSSGTAVTLSTTTAGATIYYTTNGSTPTTASTQYTSPISITAATTIKARAVKSGMDNSSVLTAAYTILQPANTPTANIAAGTVVSGTTITLSTTTAGATIYYTTNGSTPTTASTQYTSPISITAATTIKAIAVKSGMTTSGVLTAAYTIATGTAKVIYTWVNENDQIVTSGASATLSRGAGETLTISTTGSGYSDFQWSYNGSVVTGATTGSYTFNSAGKTNGIYNIGLQVKKDNAWYSTLIAITLTN